MKHNLADTVAYGGLHPLVALQMNLVIYESLALFPEIRHWLQFLGAERQYREWVSEDRKEAIQRRVRFHMSRNPSLDRKELELRVKAQVQPFRLQKRHAAFASYGLASGIVVNERYAGGVKSSDGVMNWRRTMFHEVGHLLDAQFGLSEHQVISRLAREYPYSGRASGLSAYGATCVVEFIAEGWAEYNTHPNPRSLAKTVGQYLLDEVVIARKRCSDERTQRPS